MARGRRSTKNNIQSQSQSTNISLSTTSQHNKLCECCGTPNNLQHCTTCNLVFHSSCYPSSSSPPSTASNDNELFNSDWSCAYCIIDGNGIDFSSSSKLSVEEQQIEARKVVSMIEGMKNNAQQQMSNNNNTTNNNNTKDDNTKDDNTKDDNMEGEEENSWTCHKCNNNNPSSRSRCVNCLGWKKKKSKVGMKGDDNNNKGNISSSTREGVRNSGGGGAANKKMVRNIAQPKSYKEPSTSCKLHSGDVNFPKEQQQQQQQQCARGNDDDSAKKQQLGMNGAAGNDEDATSNEPVESQTKDDGKSEVVVKEVTTEEEEDSGDKKAVQPTSDEHNTANSAASKQTTTVQSSDNSKKDNTSSTNPKPQQQPNQPNNEIMQPLLPSNFNTTLKAALNSYHNSTTLVKSENNPQPLPIPPPFLSHVEECTLKTALAFVLAKANKKGSGEIKKETIGSSSNLLLPSNDDGRGVGSSTMNSSLIRGSMGKASGRMGSIINNSVLDNNDTPQRTCGVTSLLGGLLPLPSSRRITPLPGLEINPERKLQHVRDVLKLAVSAVLPLYRGALEVKEESSSAQYKEEEDDDATTLEQSEPQSTTKKNESRKPCAVYDYEAAVETASSSSVESTRQLDGLCDHAITRLSALIRQEELLKSKGSLSRVGRSYATNISTKTKENDDDESNANGSPTVVTNKSGEARSINTLSLHSKQQGGNNIRDAIMKLIYNDLIGDAYHHGSSHLSKHSRRLSTDIERECAERRIEKIMAVCHVLHRMLFLDKTSSLGTECVVVICSILSELYSNQYHGRTFMDNDGQDEDGDSKSNGSSSSSEKQRRLTSNKNHGNKDKYQVVSSRWGGTSSMSSNTSSYINDRHERRLQSVDILSQRRFSGAKRSSQIIQENQEGEKKKQLPLPRIGDVLAVNLLRLLEGAAAIRLHHRQQSSSPPLSSSRYHHRTSSRKDDEYMLEKAASMAATEVLTEIRSNMEHELITPFLVEDSAAFFFCEKVRSAGDSAVLLHSGGKMMMRLHVFSLLNKLQLYEQ